MPAAELQIGNRTAYFRKAITTPDFTRERVLARDAFEFAELWLKRECREALPYWDHTLTLIMAAMHRLSELSRYDPRGLMSYLDGKENWLLTEFIELAPAQFMDELVCEMTSLEFGIPGIRPRST